MPVTTDDRVEIPEEIDEVTEEDAKENPSLLGDEKAAKDGVLDLDRAELEELELKADLEVILDEADDSGPDAAGPSLAGASAAGGKPSAHQLRALKLAVSQKGVREEPPGSNNNKYSRYFGFGPQFWCADFVAFCVDKTGKHPDKKVPWGYPSAVKTINAWGQRKGTIHSRPRKGDIFTYKSNKHTGFVLSVQGSRFTTIEGNTSGPLGDVYVASHVRDASSGMYFFIRDALSGA
jgi:hypothetical protein